MSDFGRSVKVQLVYGTEIVKEIHWYFIRCPNHADEIYKEILDDLYKGGATKGGKG